MTKTYTLSADLCAPLSVQRSYNSPVNLQTCDRGYVCKEDKTLCADQTEGKRSYYSTDNQSG